MIKNTLLKYLDKSGNPERLKKSWQFKSFSTNVPIVGKELLMAFYRLVLHFGDSSDLWKKKEKKKMFSKGFNSNLRYNCNYNSHRFSYKFAFILFFVLSNKPKTRIRFSASWLSGNEKYLVFVYSECHALLQSHVKFNRLL